MVHRTETPKSICPTATSDRRPVHSLTLQSDACTALTAPHPGGELGHHVQVALFAPLVPEKLAGFIARQFTNWHKMEVQTKAPGEI